MANYVFNSASSGETYNAKCLNVSDDSEWFPTVPPEIDPEYPGDGTIDLSGGVAGRYLDTQWEAPQDTEWTMSGIYNVEMGVSYDMYSIHYKTGNLCDIYLGSSTEDLALSEEDKPYTPPTGNWIIEEEPPSIIIPGVEFDVLDPFGDSSVITYIDFNGDIADEVGGTVFSDDNVTYTTGVNGVEQCSVFDPTSQSLTQNGRVPINEEFTVSWWGRKPSNIGGAYVANRSTTTPSEQEFLISFDDPDSGLNFYCISDTNFVTAITTTLLASDINQWDYIICTVNRDATTSTMDIYVNGVHDGTNTYTVVREQGATRTSIGGQFTNTSPLTGNIDNMHFFNRGINATEALELYTGMGGV